MTLPRTPSFRLDGRRARVTGAGRGLGLACAAALAEVGAEAGAEVWLAARAVVLDVTDTAAVARTVTAHGPFQVLVNNAGTNRPKPIDEVSEDDLDALYRLNPKGAFLVAREASRGRKAAGLPGSIVQMSSQMGPVGAVGRTAYLRDQTCARRFQQGARTRAWPAPHPRRHRLPDLHRHADDARLARGTGLSSTGACQDCARAGRHRNHVEHVEHVEHPRRHLPETDRFRPDPRCRERLTCQPQ